MFSRKVNGYKNDCLEGISDGVYTLYQPANSSNRLVFIRTDGSSLKGLKSEFDAAMYLLNSFSGIRYSQENPEIKDATHLKVKVKVSARYYIANDYSCANIFVDEVGEELHVIREENP